MKWETVKLSECCSSIADGDHQSMPLSDSGIPFIVIADIRANSVDLSNSRFVPNSYYEALDVRRKPQKGDVLYTVKGSFGIPAYVNTNNPFTFQRDIAILKCNERVNSRFLYYVLKSDKYYKIADSLAIGSAQRALTLRTLNDLTIPCPPLETQKRIADILSAYDDLIENNQKQIKLLEEAAQRLYKEWFVDLRFPGHEHTPIVDGVPEGWTKKTLEDIAYLRAGGDRPKSFSKYRNQTNTVPVYSNGSENDGLYGFTNIPDIKEMCVTISARGNVGFACLRRTPFVPIVRLICVIPKDIDVIYLYLYLRNSTYDSNGAAQQQITVPMIKPKKVLIPSLDVVKEFKRIVLPLHDQIDCLKDKIEKLTEARDRLLPKLMSGEMEV